MRFFNNSNIFVVTHPVISVGAIYVLVIIASDNGKIPFKFEFFEQFIIIHYSTLVCIPSLI